MQCRISVYIYRYTLAYLFQWTSKMVHSQFRNTCRKTEPLSLHEDKRLSADLSIGGKNR